MRRQLELPARSKGNREDKPHGRGDETHTKPVGLRVLRVMGGIGQGAALNSQYAASLQPESW